MPCAHVRALAPAAALSSRHHSSGQTKVAAWQPVLRSSQRGAIGLQVRSAAASGAPLAPWKQQNARLVLEDGSVWHGSAFGASGTTIAEVVFNTSMSGYQVRWSAALRSINRLPRSDTYNRGSAQISSATAPAR